MHDAPETVQAADPPTEQLVAGTVGERCVTCGTPLSSDQRYCVSCGERRGAARFTLPRDTRADERPQTAAPASRPRPPRGSSGATLVAGVGTLLLAMGVGVLIGHDTANSSNRVTQAAAAPAVITVGGAAAGTTSTSARSGSGASSSRSGKGAKHGKPAKGAPSAAVAKKASQAASKVLGSSASNLPPATVTVGQSGSGPGFNKKTHKFDGSFFGQ